MTCIYKVMLFAVDYLRVITAFVSFYYLPTDPWSASFWYLLSGFLDAIDGHLARMLDQGTRLIFSHQLNKLFLFRCLSATLC